MTDKKLEDKKPIILYLEDFLQYRFPERDLILSPWLSSQSLNMIYSWRGVGKTHVALGIAYAVASGGSFLGWKADKPQGVLYIDGEMSGIILQERLKKIVANYDYSYIKEMFQIYASDIPNNAVMPDLATLEGQSIIDQYILPSIKLIIIDNLSCLVRSGGRENDSESWREISGWALQKRLQGKSIIFIHHSGKDGSQRGTSKREDVLDTVISLKQPCDYEPSQGARFEVHFEKARHLHGDHVKPFTVNLEQQDNSYKWNTITLTESNRQKIITMSQEGMTNSEIASDLGISRQAVFKHLKKAKEEGLI
jgi:RecA-family ATPase